MALQIIRNNITNVEADAIVNTANPKVAVGPGVDYAIYTAAGWDRLLEARAVIGPMKPGEVAYTPAFDLDAKYIIHAIGPAWRGGSHGERETVAKCYSKSLKLAAELGCESIAFPLLATGTYGFPKDEALRIAMAEISRFLLENEMEVMLVVYDKESFEVSGKLFSDIKSFIGDPEPVKYSAPGRNYYSNRGSRRRVLKNLRKDRAPKAKRPVEETEDLEVSIDLEDLTDKDTEFFSEALLDIDLDLMEESKSVVSDDYFSGYGGAGGPAYAPAFPTPKESLDDRIIHLDKTFQEYLFMLIDRRGLTDTEVYKKANIDRKHFSKIRSNVDYTPSKKTALALAIALELSLDETRDLLARAGLALSPSIVYDQIIGYCIEHGNYDIYEINCVLFKYDQPTLGA